MRHTQHNSNTELIIQSTNLYSHQRINLTKKIQLDFSQLQAIKNIYFLSIDFVISLVFGLMSSFVAKNSKTFEKWKHGMKYFTITISFVFTNVLWYTIKFISYWLRFLLWTYHRWLDDLIRNNFFLQLIIHVLYLFFDF